MFDGVQGMSIPEIRHSLKQQATSFLPEEYRQESVLGVEEMLHRLTKDMALSGGLRSSDRLAMAA